MNIAIVGTVGIGKTTIIEEIRKKLVDKKIKSYFNIEEEKYIYLEEMYNNMKKFSLISQYDFLMLRFRSLFPYNNKNEKFVFFDRSYIDDYIYAKFANKNNNISNKEFEAYKKVFNGFHNLFYKNEIFYDKFIVLIENEKGIAEVRRKKRDRYNEKELHHFREIDEHYESNEFELFFKNKVKEYKFIKNINTNDTVKEILGFIGINN